MPVKAGAPQAFPLRKGKAPYIQGRGAGQDDLASPESRGTLSYAMGEAEMRVERAEIPRPDRLRCVILTSKNWKGEAMTMRDHSWVIHSTVTALLLTGAVLPHATGQTDRGADSTIMSAVDADDNGVLSADEIDNAPAALRQLDNNGNNKLEESELADSNGPPDGFGLPSGSELNQPPKADDPAEERILNALEEIRQGEWYYNVSQTDGRLLRLLTEATNAKRVVEIGTSTGYSSIWFALALRDTGGHLYTHEIDPERIRKAKKNFSKAGVSDQITVIKGNAHKTVTQHKKPIDILFLDADKQGYIDYLDKLLPRIKPGGLILAHNMRVPEPDPRFVETITGRSELETVFVLMEGAGISVTLKKR